MYSMGGQMKYTREGREYLAVYVAMQDIFTKLSTEDACTKTLRNTIPNMAW